MKVCRQKIGGICFGLSAFLANAKVYDLGTYGTTFPIQEKNLIFVLKEKMESKEGVEKLSLFEKEFLSLQQGKKLPNSISSIQYAQEERHMWRDPSVQLSMDLKDHLGNIFYKAGEKVNPLNHMTLSKGYIFIDGELKEHLLFARKVACQKPMMIILVKGDPLKLMRENPGLRLYFDQDGIMCTRFQITRFPSTLEQEGKMLHLIEHKVGSTS